MTDTTDFDPQAAALANLEKAGELVREAHALVNEANALYGFYGVPRPTLKVLAARSRIVFDCKPIQRLANYIVVRAIDRHIKPSASTIYLVQHSVGIADSRYRVSLEYTGAPEQEWVLRYCDDFVKAYTERADAILAALDLAEEHRAGRRG